MGPCWRLALTNKKFPVATEVILRQRRSCYAKISFEHSSWTSSWLLALKQMVVFGFFFLASYSRFAGFADTDQKRSTHQLICFRNTQIWLRRKSLLFWKNSNDICKCISAALKERLRGEARLGKDYPNCTCSIWRKPSSSLSVIFLSPSKILPFQSSIQDLKKWGYRGNRSTCFPRFPEPYFIVSILF